MAAEAACSAPTPLPCSLCSHPFESSSSSLHQKPQDLCASVCFAWKVLPAKLCEACSLTSPLPAPMSPQKVLLWLPQLKQHPQLCSGALVPILSLLPNMYHLTRSGLSVVDDHPSRLESKFHASWRLVPPCCVLRADGVAGPSPERVSSRFLLDRTVAR